jgi:hypothetical protein
LDIQFDLQTFSFLTIIQLLISIPPSYKHGYSSANKVLRAELLDGRDQRLVAAAQAEAARHDRYAVM